MIKELPIEQFNPSVDKIILDVRDAQSYHLGHIEHAKNAPIDALTEYLPTDTTADIYVLCGGGTKAARACSYLNELYPTRNIIHLIGGTRGAIAHGMTIITETSE
ncbi:rhodanese-like domain-containing protein [Moraxella haemolytica]|uniref:rhodanese-like domain-containing protein n=1 Tax=Moraxella TaxID=475 RepID=UPI0025432E0B|nr:rhodanese-like domain-containing protein [Moraxella sp. ZY171148]WII94752.1 rhodanese-like domain-containing protein [Moraxella sp. ZY171148]